MLTILVHSAKITNHHLAVRCSPGPVISEVCPETSTCSCLYCSGRSGVWGYPRSTDPRSTDHSLDGARSSWWRHDSATYPIPSLCLPSSNPLPSNPTSSSHRPQPCSNVKHRVLDESRRSWVWLRRGINVPV